MDFNWVSILWVACYTVVVVATSLYGVHRYSMLYLFWKNRKNVPRPKAYFESLPKVTVQLPVFNEMHVVERLIRKVADLDYPKELLEIQILDDSTDETQALCQREAEKLRARGFNVAYIHRDDRTGFKAGALQNGMATATGEFIYILDADFVPAPNALKEKIHFFTDENVAVVQSRWGHLNRTYSLLTKLQAMFMDGHLVVEQTARCRSGRFLNFNGTAGIWRRSAIEDAGGWQHDTLTEDLDLSYRAQMRGWKFIFLVDFETPAELPVDMDGFKAQQHRWAKGSIQTCKKILPSVWKSDLPFLIKLEATAHLTSNFAFLLIILICFIVWPDVGQRFEEGGADKSGLAGWRIVLVDIPVFLLTTGSICLYYIVGQMALFPKNWRSQLRHLPGLLALAAGLSINNGKAVIEAIFNHHTPFVRTPKYGVEKTGDHQWKKKARYKALKSVATSLEILLAIYFSVVTVLYILKNNWISVPFMALFVCGFWYVALGSLSLRLGKKNLAQ